MPGVPPSTVIPLVTEFRFAHEPVSIEGADHFVGRESELEALAERIFFSAGGSFLITGYRGVGKTSFVNQVIRKVRAKAAEQSTPRERVIVVDVHLSVARPMSPTELMHHTVRRLYDRLDEMELLGSLPHRLREALETANLRTSVAISQKVVESVGREFGIDPSIALPLLAAPLKVTAKRSRSRSTDQQMQYLPYDDKAAENDVLRLARALAAGFTPRARWPRRMLNAITRRRPAPVRLKVVLVFDELDKLEEEPPDASQRPFLDRLLSDLKNVFTTSGISFVFVAGKDLHDRWLQDVGRGDSVYESVFCYDRYLPCMWTDVGDVCARFLLPAPDQPSGDAADFVDFLNYRGRGIPRRIIREFNQYVRWESSAPKLIFTRDDVRRFHFYAELHRTLEQRAQELFARSSAESSPTEQDKQRLTAYYVVDWVLAHGSVPFTAEDAMAAAFALSVKIAPAKDVAPAAIAGILRVLVENDFLQEVSQNLGQTIYPEADSRRSKRYKLTPRRLAELGRFAAVYEEDRAPVAAVIGATVSRYTMLELIGEGGAGAVYRARDNTLGRIVALKLLDRELTRDQGAVARFRREASILSSLNHPNIVKFFDVVNEGDTRGIAMEYVDGISLHQLVKRHVVPLPIALAITRTAAGAIAYIHSLGIARVDVKPSNVLLRRDGHVFLTDFGISKRLEDDGGDHATRPGLLIGTPQYMAPEQFADVIDPRSDVYSLGVVLFQMVTGKLPFEGNRLPQLINAIANNPAPRISELAEVPAALDELVARCLAKSPEDRPTAEEFVPDIDELGISLPTDLGPFVHDAIQRRDSDARQNDEATGAFAMADFIPERTTVEPTPTPEPTGEFPTLITQMLATPAAVLVVQEPAHLGRLGFALPREVEKVTIGRNSDADVMIPDSSISSFHAEIAVRGDDYVVRDFKSFNGTYVNGEKIDDERVLHDGDVVRFGKVITEFRRPQAEAPAA